MSTNTPPASGSRGDIDMSNGAVSPLLGKRKRSPGDNQNDSEFDDNDDELAMPDDDFIAPDYNSDEDINEDDGRGDDDSENDMEESDVPQTPYSESIEPYPACPIYDPDIARISKELTGIPQQVLEILATHGGAHVTAQIEAANKLLTVPKSAKVRIGLLGDAGAGKSSLLNSITDLDDLAKSLSGGESCTCVPTEYSSAFPTQRKAFAASVRYLDIEKIKIVLQEMLGDYNEYVFEFDRYWDEDVKTQNKLKMASALKTFRVLFCDLKEFSSDQNAKGFLKSNREDESVHAIDLFMDSCEKKLKDKITLDHGYAEFIEASTRTRLRDIIDPLMGAKGKNGQPALWPLVRHVVIGVRGSRVLEHLTIVDLPGTSDTNTVRKELCQKYIKNCDHLWIVAPIKRVVDDTTVHSALVSYGHRFRGKIALICTHADDNVDRKLANHLRDEGCDVDAYFDASQQWKEKKKEITAINLKIKTMRNRKKPTKQMILDVQASEDMLKVLKKDWATIDATRFEFLVKARVAHVSAKLEEEAHSHIPAGSSVAIFCVSNFHYGAHKGTAKVNGPRLSVRVTGIPALRAYALKLPGPLLMGSLNAFANHSITAFLKSTNMWVDTTSVARRKELLELVVAPQKQLKFRLQQHSHNFKKTAKEGIVKALETNMEKILEVAFKKLEEKKLKNHGSIRAFIRKNGNHSSKVCAKDCWNESFTMVVHHLVDEEGPTWGNGFLENISTTKNQIIADMQGVLTSIEEQLSAVALPMDKIRKLIGAQVIGVENVFDIIVEAYKEDYGNIALDMTQDSEQNYFSRSMRPIYESCKTDYGTGVTKRSVAKVEKHLKDSTDDSPFVVLQRCAIKAMTANDERHMSKFALRKIEEIFGETLTAFDSMIRKTVEDPKEAKARREMKSAIHKIEDDLFYAKKDLTTVKQKYAIVL